MRLVFLGTSAGIPTINRSLSGMALCLEPEVALFDCGEGTQMQLRKADIRTSKIRRIFLSHMHGDHVNGLMGLLMSMDMDSRTDPVDIYGPPDAEKMVAALRRFLRTGISFPVRFHGTREGVLCETKLYTVTCAPVRHRISCHAFALNEIDRPGRFDIDRARELGIPAGPLYGKLQHGGAVTLADGRTIQPEEVVGPARPGRRVVFATDTRPCDETIRLAYGADVLVHEATFGEDLPERAAETGHSTAHEAARVAADACVKTLILTHFSSRYPNEKQLAREAAVIFPNVLAAHDLMEYVVPGANHEE